MPFLVPPKQSRSTPAFQVISAGELPQQSAELTATALVGAANEVLAGPLAHPRSGTDAAEVITALRTLWRRAAGG